MEELKLTINMLPKGAWNNDFSKTLSKKDWDKLREFALKRANGKCEICGFETNIKKDYCNLFKVPRS